ncbi:MAG: hypothetical protein JNM27_18050 [Leptospirales bacterium]|nr:hypothetical protein [Leptospirales bacterium]
MGLIVLFVVAGLTWLQGTQFLGSLGADTLKRGRIVLSSGDEAEFSVARNREGSARLVLDGDPATYSTLYFPSSHPEGTHLLADLALSHFPGRPPVRRKPLALHFLNGAPPPVFDDFARPKEVRLALLSRRANDPDVENVIPEANIVWETTVTFPDAQDFEVPLPVSPPGPSSNYPQNVKLWILKLTVLSVYPGKKYFHNVAIREIDYIDTDEYANKTVWSAKK